MDTGKDKNSLHASSGSDGLREIASINNIIIRNSVACRQSTLSVCQHTSKIAGCFRHKQQCVYQRIVTVAEVDGVYLQQGHIPRSKQLDKYAQAY